MIFFSLKYAIFCITANWEKSSGMIKRHNVTEMRCCEGKNMTDFLCAFFYLMKMKIDFVIPVDNNADYVAPFHLIHTPTLRIMKKDRERYSFFRGCVCRFHIFTIQARVWRLIIGRSLLTSHCLLFSTLKFSNEFRPSYHVCASFPFLYVSSSLAIFATHIM